MGVNRPDLQFVEEVEEASLKIEEYVPDSAYGIPVDSLEILEGVVQKNETLADLLLPYQVAFSTIHQLEKLSKDVYNTRYIKAGRPYTILTLGDSLQTAQYFIYHKNPKEYVVYGMKDSLQVYEGKREVVLEEKVVTGEIKSSLYNAILKNGGGSQALVNRLENVFAWQIDFFHIQKGDRFKVIYEVEKIEGKEVGLGRIKAAVFEHNEETFYAFLYEHHGGQPEYYDDEGNSLRKAFLKAPLNFSRISSRFSRRRFHPVQKRFKAHLGTDYAAPRGTPIYAVGDGTVVAKGYTRGNGNYVKVKHNGVYTTQYLHMSKFKSGLRKGQFVKQGQVIGYVGSTGLATGPHLCFRFWKNGRQVDWLREKLPASDPIEGIYREEYEKHMVVMKKQLDDLLYEDDYSDELEPLAKGNDIKDEQ
ncbi:peptidoglycan DD-metalloendopeptidase family protein [Algivirga pacifica]|uniref:Peptidoglycan DD-metalloendopeptidase family protein n=2 Tax=Algivirga pacifica TaxID=1162670 RepID=A0ABP9DC77_9BACT